MSIVIIVRLAPAVVVCSRNRNDVVVAQNQLVSDFHNFRIKLWFN